MKKTDNWQCVDSIRRTILSMGSSSRDFKVWILWPEQDLHLVVGQDGTEARWQYPLKGDERKKTTQPQRARLWRLAVWRTGTCCFLSRPSSNHWDPDMQPWCLAEITTSRGEMGQPELLLTSCCVPWGTRQQTACEWHSTDGEALTLHYLIWFWPQAPFHRGINTKLRQIHWLPRIHITISRAIHFFLLSLLPPTMLSSESLASPFLPSPPSSSPIDPAF